MKTKRTGIYGGTFNPPHLGHVHAAESFVKTIMLDELLIIPDFIPPHKEYKSDVTPQDRLNMCSLAFSHIPNATVSDIEIKREGRSYTYITLGELSEDGRELYFLCGTDMFLTLDQWRNPEVIFRLATICYVRREKDSQTAVLLAKKEEEYIEKYGAKIIPVISGVTEISSSELRSELESGAVDSKHISKSVMEYISKRGLYR